MEKDSSGDLDSERFFELKPLDFRTRHLQRLAQDKRAWKLLRFVLILAEFVWGEAGNVFEGPREMTLVEEARRQGDLGKRHGRSFGH